MLLFSSYSRDSSHQLSLDNHHCSLLSLRWYLSLSIGMHIIVIAIAALYFAFSPTRVPKSLPASLQVLNLAPIPEVPSPETARVVTPEDVAPQSATPMVSTLSEPKSRQVTKPIYKPIKPPKEKKSDIQKALPDEQLARFYPDAYIPLQLNGEVTLRLFIEPGTGTVLAARIEVPSPYPLFNEAAKMAALALVPKVNQTMQQEVFLPVRFRYGR
jgi:outer membrane biosynthesis protein TonB